MRGARRPEPREPSRLELRLTGNMERYMWSINGVKYGDAEPLRLKYGERVRIKFVNQTMMNHPIHLHGLWQILRNGQGDYAPRKHVVNVSAGETVTDSIGAILHKQPDWERLPAETPPTVQLLLRRCLAKDRKRRLQDIGDAAASAQRGQRFLQSFAVHVRMAIDQSGNNRAPGAIDAPGAVIGQRTD